MKYKKIFLFIAIAVYLSTLSGCVSEPEIKVVNFEELRPVFHQQNDVLYVVNFWATWCAPCVKEIPDFMEVNSEFSKSDNYKMILVSLDDSDKLEEAVKPFIVDKKINDVDLYLLDDIKRMNEWIPAVDSAWSGSIPATLFIRNGKSLKFVSSAIEKDELRMIILELIQDNK